MPSRRLLSTAGGVTIEHRARHLPDDAERLIFLKYNASLIKSEYGVVQLHTRLLCGLTILVVFLILESY